MRKRVVSLAMAAAMALSLTACGSSSSKTDTDELFRFADEPRGSLSTYSTKTTDLYQKIEKSLKEFKIKHIQNK